MIVEISPQTLLTGLGMAGALVANGLAVLRMFNQVERRLAVIETRIRYIEREIGAREDAEPTKPANL